MAKFEIAYAITMKTEAGYANDPDDTGGETFAGVSRVANHGWPGWVIIDAIKKTTAPKDYDKVMFANKELMAHVRQVYKTLYWDVNRLDNINDQALANEMFDTGVNCGTGIAAEFLQRALNLTNLNQQLYPDMNVDRKIGGTTISTTNNHPRPDDVFFWLNMLQAGRYISIMESNRTQEKFARSWRSRVSIIRV